MLSNKAPYFPEVWFKNAVLRIKLDSIENQVCYTKFLLIYPNKSRLTQHAYHAVCFS